MQIWTRICLVISAILITPLYGENDLKLPSTYSKQEERECNLFINFGGLEYIQSIDIEKQGWVHECGITPEQIIHALANNEEEIEEQIKQYTLYRAAHRVQQRLKEENAGRKFLHRVASYYLYQWDNTTPDVMNLARILLPGGVEVADLSNGEGMYYANSGKIVINKSHIHNDPPQEVLLTIEHEITHSEHYYAPRSTTPLSHYDNNESNIVDFLYSQKQFNVDIDPESHYEFEAECEAARFTPLAHTIQLYREALQGFTAYHEIVHALGRQYPPLIWQRDILAERASTLSHKEIIRQQTITRNIMFDAARKEATAEA